MMDTLAVACREGRLGRAQQIVEEFNVTATDIRAVCMLAEAGAIEVAVWLADQFDLTPLDARDRDNKALIVACSDGNLEIVQWHFERFGLTEAEADISGALHWAVHEGHDRIARWIHAHCARQQSTKGMQHEHTRVPCAPPKIGE
jgi:hypothetical protein